MSPLSLTKQHLQNMKEADLRIQVLIPLFKAMGFKDVSHYHGGTGEQGKDITRSRRTRGAHPSGYIG